MRSYRDRPLREILDEEQRFWKAVTVKAQWLYRNPC
jgi:hypothetical protein